jgi:hypothetical protein
MLFIVEITLDGNLGEQLRNMRNWLGHDHCDAVAFRRSRSGWHVDFESESKAQGFAQAFYGRMLNAASGQRSAMLAPA